MQNMKMQVTNKLQIVTLLDSISFALIYPFLSTYIQSLGANHIVVGILAAGSLLCRLIPESRIKLMKTCRMNLVFVLCVIMLTHLSLILTSSYWLIIFGRYIFSAASNYNNYLCKGLLVQNRNVDQNQKEHILAIFSILSGTGYIIGPVIAGYLFSNGFLYIGLLAVLLSFINICIVLTISDDDSNIPITNSDETPPSDNKIFQTIKEITNNCLNTRCDKNWDIMTIKFLCTSCVTIFYGKFSQLLNYNYHSSSKAVGYTYAYMNVLTFFSTYCATSLKSRYAHCSPVILLDNALKFLCVCLFVACYSPVYALYMIICIPIVLLNTFVDFVWEDLFITRKDESLSKLNEPLKMIAATVTPIVFGVFCNIIGHHAVILFSLIPVILSVFILHTYTKRYVLFKEA